MVSRHWCYNWKKTGSYVWSSWASLTRACLAPFCCADAPTSAVKATGILQLASAVHIWERKLQSGVRLSTYPESTLFTHVRSMETRMV